jgi:hypothetical protein
MSFAPFIALLAVRHEGLRTDPICGRWDLVITKGSEKAAGWLEVRASGMQTLVGRVMIGVGSARPIAEVVAAKTDFHFSIPSQWESRADTVSVTGSMSGKDSVAGDIHGGGYDGAHFTGHRAPKLLRSGRIRWGRPIDLLASAGYWVKTPGWFLERGTLYNRDPHADIVTKRKFGDFRVHCEYRYPKDSNSGIYLRGRYEVQIEDDFGHNADSEGSGGIYGVLAPLINAAKRPGQWQSADVELVGRKVSVTLNGVKVIENQIIPGPTGGALDADEAAPGPLKLQGDHGPIEFRKVVILPRAG